LGLSAIPKLIVNLKELAKNANEKYEVYTEDI